MASVLMESLLIQAWTHQPTEYARLSATMFWYACHRIGTAPHGLSVLRRGPHQFFTCGHTLRHTPHRQLRNLCVTCWYLWSVQPAKSEEMERVRPSAWEAPDMLESSLGSSRRRPREARILPVAAPQASQTIPAAPMIASRKLRNTRCCRQARTTSPATITACARSWFMISATASSFGLLICTAGRF